MYSMYGDIMLRDVFCRLDNVLKDQTTNKSEVKYPCKDAGIFLVLFYPDIKACKMLEMLKDALCT